MEKIISAFQKEIKSLKHSLKINQDMLKIVDDSNLFVYEGIMRIENQLDWHVNELQFIKKYQQCDCSKLRKLFGREYQVYSYGIICQCKKCNKYFSK